MKVLLIQPNSFTIRGLVQPPLGLMQIAAYAVKNNYDVKIHDRNMSIDTINILKKYRPDVVGISSLTSKMILDGINISKYIKENYPNVKIVWGGIHPSLLPINTLENEYIDFVVIGEGEETFLELLKSMSNGCNYGNVVGIGYKQNNQVLINKPRSFIKDLDSLPLVAWQLVNYKHYMKHETLFVTSRGCPHRCAFCHIEKYANRQWRSMSVKRVQMEIENAANFSKIRRFRFDDDNFTVDRNRFFSILDILPKNIPLYFETRVDYIDDDFCKKLKDFKEVFIFIGIESGNDEMLNKLQKDIVVKQIRKGFELLNRYNLKTSGSFIVGAPGETMEQLKDTTRLIDEIRPTRPSCCIYFPVPGAKLTDELIKSNKLNHFKTLADWGTYVSSERANYINFSEIPLEELNRTYRKYWYKFIFIFILQGKFNWIFKGIKNCLYRYYLNIIKRLFNLL